ncbi:MAG: glycosyltransferase [Gemmatimonadales bacterium]
MIRVLFAGRGGVQSLEDRARGLARHFPPDISADFDFDQGGDASFFTRRMRPFRVFSRTARAAAPYDVLWLMSQSPLRLMAASLGRLALATPFIVDTGDLLYESVRTAGKPAPYCALVRAWEWLSVRVPDAVVVRGSHHAELLKGVKRVTLVRDGVECSQFARQDGTNARMRVEARDAIILGIVSTISFEPQLGLPSPGWDLVECLARLADLKLIGLVIGDGPGLVKLRELAEQRGVANRMRWVGRVPLDELAGYLGAIDVFLHTALNNPMSWVRTTGKLPLLLASGCAAVVSEVGEAASVLQGTGMLLPFDGRPAEYAERLAERVRSLITKGELKRWRESGPEIARREFDYAQVARIAEALIRRVAKPGPQPA